jgi:hypothetical protein
MLQKFVKDIIDKGAIRNASRVKSVKSYLKLAITGLALVISLNNNIIDFISQYSAYFPILTKFLPIVLLFVLMILFINVFREKLKNKDGKLTYKNTNWIRQTAKFLALMAFIAFCYVIFGVVKNLKPIEQPLIVFIKDMHGKPIPELNLRITNEQKEDITEGFAETSTVDGMAIISSKKIITHYSYLLIKQNNELVYIPFSDARIIDTLVFNKTAYYFIIK